MHPGGEGHFIFRLSRQRGALNYVQNPVVMRLNLVTIIVANVIPCARVIWHDVRYFAAVLDNVVDARSGLDVFAHKIDTEVSMF